MRPITFLLPALTLLVPVSPCSGQSHEQDITVQALHITPANWATAVGRKLDRALEDTPMTGADGYSGVVSIRFRLDGANRPEAMVVSRTSHARALDRVAMTAIRRVGILPPTPAAFRHDQQFVANIAFARDWSEQRRQLAMLRKEAQMARYAGRSSAGDAVAFVITASAGARS